MGNAKNHSVPAAWYLGSWFDSRISMSKHNLRFVNFLIVRRTTHQEKSFIKVNRDSFMRSYPVDFAVVTAYYKALSNCTVNSLQRIQNACLSFKLAV